MKKNIKKQIFKLIKVENLKLKYIKKINLFNRIENNLLSAIKSDKNFVWDYIKYDIFDPNRSLIYFSVYKNLEFFSNFKL